MADCLANMFVMQLDINIGGLLVKDSFGWNPYRALSNVTDGDEPEQFGSALASDLGLDASGATLIAVEIREQLWRHFQVYSVLLLAHPFPYPTSQFSVLHKQDVFTSREL